MPNKAFFINDILMRSNQDSLNLQSIKISKGSVTIELSELSIIYDSIALRREKNSLSLAYVFLGNKKTVPIKIQNFEWYHIFDNKILNDENYKENMDLRNISIEDTHSYRFETKANQDSFNIGDEIKARIEFTFTNSEKKSINIFIEIMLNCGSEPVPWFLP